MRSKTIAACVCAASALIWALAAHAVATSSSEATINWSSVVISPAVAIPGTGGALAGYGDAWATNNVDPPSPSITSIQFDWNDLPFIFNNITNTHSEAGITGGILIGRSNALADGITTTASDAKGSIGREGTFDVVGEGGAFTLSLEYSFGHNMSRGIVGEGVAAVTDIYFWVSLEGATSELDRVEAHIRNDQFGSDPLTGTFTGSNMPLSMSVGLLEGQRYRFGASAQAGSSARAPLLAVPEPDTYAMLLAGLGLLGFFACAGKRKAA
jgi:hypothetical protein